MCASRSSAQRAIRGLIRHKDFDSYVGPTTIATDIRGISSSPSPSAIKQIYLKAINDVIQNEVWREVYYGRLHDSAEALSVSSAKIFYEAIFKQNVEKSDFLGLSNLSLGVHSLERLCSILKKGKIPHPPPRSSEHNISNNKNSSASRTRKISSMKAAAETKNHQYDSKENVEQFHNPLHNYKSVDLSFNILGDNSSQEIAFLLKLLGRVKHLNISNNKITATGAKLLGQRLKDNTTLQWLQLGKYINPKKDYDVSHTHPSSSLTHIIATSTESLSRNNTITTAGLQALLDNLKTNQVLLRLSLCQTGLTEEAGQVLKLFFCVNNSMNQFDLSGNPLRAKGVNDILTSGTHLRHLDLTDTQIEGEDIAEALIQLLHSTKALTSLKLGKNRIGPKAVQSISEAAAACPSLEVLDLNTTYLYSEGLLSFAQNYLEASKTRLIALTNLNLSSLQLEPHDTQSLTGFKCLCEFLVASNVSELKLNSNPLGDQECQLLADVLKNPTTQLRSLELCNCRLTDLEALTIAQGLSTNQSLLTLRLNDNCFKGSCEEALRNTFESNSTLQEIRLAGGRLSHAFLLKIDKLCTRNKANVDTLVCKKLKHSISQLLSEEQRLKLLQQQIREEENQINQNRQLRKECLDNNLQQQQENKQVKKELLSALSIAEQDLKKKQHLLEAHQRSLLQLKKDNNMQIRGKQENLAKANEQLAEVNQNLRALQHERNNYDTDMQKRRRDFKNQIAKTTEENKLLQQKIKLLEEELRSGAQRKTINSEK